MAKDAVEDWSTTAANNTDIGGIDIAENCPAAGINNAIRELMEQFATWLAALFATATNVWAGSSTTKAITPDALKDAVAWNALSISAAAVSPDMAAGLNFTVALTENITLNNMANLVVGYGGYIEFTQDATGGRTVSKPGSSKYYGPGGFPTVDTTANAVTVFGYVVKSSTVIHLFPARGMSAA